MMAASAKRNTIKLDASFTRLSPSRIAVRRFGTLIFLSTDVAATASGGDMMPPNKNPSAKVNPGIIALDANATAVAVTNTNPKANMEITRRHFQKSAQDVNQAAS